MVRKQILLDDKHNRLTKRYAKELNESESEVIRRALDAYEPAMAEQEDELNVLAEILKESTERANKAVNKAIREANVILKEYRTKRKAANA